MSGDSTANTTNDESPISRQQRERQLLEVMRGDPMQIYAAYLKIFGTGDADAPTLTPLAMVKSLVEHEFRHEGVAND
jgi:hypothetical protein